MATPQQFDDPCHATPRRRYYGCGWSPGTSPALVALLALLVVVVFATDWYSSALRLPRRTSAPADNCPPVPFGVDFYIYPVVWGGIGAAVAAAVIGPLVSLLKGWYLSFWPLLAIAIVVLSSVAGSALTDFSGTYWHDE